ncbi:MAG: beta-lactamase family protein, partial [Nocardioides sp.]|nr:beta-lactamase family protein [Nocardioides sp.]
MRTWRWRAAVAGLCAVLVSTGCSTGPAPSQDPTPRPAAPRTTADERGDTGGVASWPTADPASLGLDGRALRRLARDARRARSSCYAVAREGAIAGEWNWHLGADQPRQVFSITKSVTSALVGIAVADGDLRLDDPVARYVPSWRGTPSARVTVRNLLANDSGRFWSLQSDYTDLVRAPDRTGYAIGLTQQFAPGTTWAYNNAAIQVLEAVLSRATGTPVEELAEERLFAPLGMADSSLIGSGSAAGAPLFFGLQTTCRDLLRFGQLYLDEGRVDGQHLLPRSFVR